MVGLRKTITQTDFTEKINMTSITSIKNIPTPTPLSRSPAGSVIVLGEGLTYVVNVSYPDSSKLVDVVIADTVTEIRKDAFKNCVNMQSVVFPNGLEHIGARAFKNCRRLRSVVLPNSIKDIGPCAFMGCQGISELVLPNAITRIDKKTFSGCYMKTVVIPDSVTSIGEDAFYMCSLLESVDIPDSAVSIEEAAFLECCHSMKVYVDDVSKIEVLKCAFDHGVKGYAKQYKGLKYKEFKKAPFKNLWELSRALTPFELHCNLHDYPKKGNSESDSTEETTMTSAALPFYKTPTAKSKDSKKQSKEKRFLRPILQRKSP
jgi:hypothetical protein